LSAKHLYNKRTKNNKTYNKIVDVAEFKNGSPAAKVIH
jgi:hypothetical protein